MLRTSSPPPMSRSIDRAICPTTRELRHRNSAKSSSGASKGAALRTQRGRHMNTSRTKRRREAEQRDAGQRDCRSEREHAEIRRRVERDPLTFIASDREKHSTSEDRHDDAENRGHDGEHRAFREQLLHQPATRRAERHADRYFASTRGGAREHQFGHIRADDQNHERDGDHEHDERGPYARVDSKIRAPPARHELESL